MTVSYTYIRLHDTVMIEAQPFSIGILIFMNHSSLRATAPTALDSGIATIISLDLP